MVSVKSIIISLMIVVLMAGNLFISNYRKLPRPRQITGIHSIPTSRVPLILRTSARCLMIAATSSSAFTCASTNSCEKGTPSMKRI